MAKIQVLDKHTAELIAAGEVVERPSSVVKELVENAIDAGASFITVAIENGGVTSLTVTDNGCGFAREDVPTAFLRHATSKLRTADDLACIGTLGFRGEALASIAAVARVELTTRTEDSLEGVRYCIEGGEEISLTEVGCARGASVCVRDLFYNVPARMKFLKKDVGEGNAVAAVVDRLALSHPEISFRFLRDGREELLTPGDNVLYSCIGSVLGREFAKTLISLDYTLGGVHVHGYICRPTQARANRTMQHFFVNGRYVKTRTAMAALEQAYKGAVMVGKFPACVLSVDMPPETVDANVHPAKIEVRFVNEKPVFDAVYHGVRSALDGDTAPKQAVLSAPVYAPVNAEEAPRSKAPTAHQQMQQVARQTEQPVWMPLPKVSSKSGNSRVVGGHSGTLRDEQTVVNSFFAGTAAPKAERQPLGSDGRREVPKQVAPWELPKEAEPANESEQTVMTTEPEPVRLVGEVLHTYIVAEWRGAVYFIDKHAAHERLLYDELKKNVQTGAQLLLAPVTVALNAEEKSALTEAAEDLRATGFELEEFGGHALLVRAVPMVLSGGDVAETLREIAGGLLAGRREITTARLDWIYHSVACRAAVKAGDNSTPQELQQLAQRVLLSDDIRTCPHGRPVCFELTAHEIEKQFGRLGS